MHGIIKPQSPSAYAERDPVPVRLWAWTKRHAYFLAIVIVPTLLATVYYYGLAADQYQSEAHFVVRTADSSPGAPGGFGQMLGITGGVSQTRSDALSVNDYLYSQEAVNKLDHSIGIVDRFRRPEADIATRLWYAQPKEESLLKYYRNQVDVKIDEESGITTLKVRSFRPTDSYDIIRELLKMGEQRVNILNQRSMNDALTAARRQLADAETSLLAIQGRMTQFRQVRGDIDPEGSGKAQIGLVSNLESSLTQARAQLASMSGIISPTSPQYIATAARVRALSAQVGAQAGKLTGNGHAIAANLGNYEDLQVRQEFAAKRYEAAAANLEKARDQVNRQQLYIVRVVEPNMATKSQFPERGKIVVTIFLSLLISYAIGWLIMAGVREHAA